MRRSAGVQTWGRPGAGTLERFNGPLREGGLVCSPGRRGEVTVTDSYTRCYSRSRWHSKVTRIRGGATGEAGAGGRRP